ncbi:ABC1 kinase family protein [Hyphomonas pacifica]|uniref:ABC transporter ATP-binding protein n=1 Tax=Hyphomonas pacifica TaxID=1280941 RepID=A0A062U8L3_9PROT|nr:AarF/UbiB family protein [Hyphomonas pacifica]KCZ52969.1 ABC transporter ATP-binding protein [Hyphomonas pacifica]RAN36172.1 ABC transporter ATP-binding protein [Hyphomonas pacifica]RAN37814.1 ABC transporter ATP-binding protein [Hyphomonas pacifica]
MTDDAPASQDPERNRLTGRLARTAKVGANLSGAGLTFAAQSLFGGDKGDEKIARALAAALGKSKGPLMKVAQMVSTIPDFLPPEYAAELSQLQAEAPAMGWPFVKRRMRAELGAGWQDSFADFEKQAAHAASLGQVHMATMHDGRRVACKLQYPDMASAVESDVGQLKTVLGLFKRMDGSIDPTAMVDEITDRLREELDYAREAKHMALYELMLRQHDFVTVPDPVLDLSTDRLLTMTWMDGKRLTAFEDAPQETRNRIAEMLFWTWWGPFNSHAVIHGDPHLGNYQVTGEGTGLNLLDFGCIRVFPPEFVSGVVDLYRALSKDDFDATFAAYEKWGFEGLSKELVEVLNIWARFIYGPLLDDRVRSVADGVTAGEYGRREAFEVRRLLKEKGPVKVPREFVFMDRAAIGLGAAYLRLGAELNFYQLFNESLDGFDIEKVAARQAEARAAVGL